MTKLRYIHNNIFIYQAEMKQTIAKTILDILSLLIHTKIHYETFNTRTSVHNNCEQDKKM